MKRIRMWITCVLLAAAAVAPAPAQQQALTLEDCVKLALEAPSAAQTAEREEAIAKERQTAARAELLPQFGLTSTYAYNSPATNGPNPFSFVALNGVREYLATADTNWSLDLSGRLRAGMAVARAGRDLADRRFGYRAPRSAPRRRPVLLRPGACQTASSSWNRAV